jgi:U3 small nucleolar RNA-associated protein 21
MTALAQSPAIDVVGIGFASGDISIYDIRADEKIMRIFVREGPVQALAFRGGKGGTTFAVSRESYSFADGHPALASASEMGHISLWDLGSGGRLLHTIRGAHDGSISSLQWIPGQPLLVSSGDDNSVKVCV